MSEHRYVNPWTSPLNLNPGDRAHNPCGLVLEWDGRRGIPVCIPCDLAMTGRSQMGLPKCPTCGGTARTPLETLECSA
jgi:hypothetical protein